MNSVQEQPQPQPVAQPSEAQAADAQAAEAQSQAQADEQEPRAVRLLPGLEVVGRGIYLRPYYPYSLGQLLFKQDEMRVTTSKETRENYLLPVGYEVNDSPPFPIDESLNQVMIEESWDRFEQQMNMSMRAKIRTGAFSVSATSSWNSQLRADQEAYYAVRSSFVPLWTVYVPDPSNPVDVLEGADVPVPYAPEHRQKYDAFFQRFGSHYVRSAWVGGKSMLIFTVFKSTQISKDDIRAGLRAGLFLGSASAQEETSKERLRSSSQCTVIGKGGDEVLLAEMSSLDQGAYNKWLTTIPQNPQVIELEVDGIWSLFRDNDKAEALKEAYRQAIAFEPIKAVFEFDRDLYFIRGDHCVRCDRRTKRTLPSQPFAEVFPVLAAEGFGRIDEAFRGFSLRSPEGEPLDRKLYVFRHNRVLRVDLDSRSTDPGFPMPLAEAFPGLPFERIDAALVTGPDTIYFFFGNRYVRFNPIKNKVDDGYPQPIAKRWVGVTFDRIDSAVYWGNSKVYFFKGDQHIRYDLANFRADPGFPKHVTSNYVEDWTFIDE